MFQEGALKEAYQHILHLGSSDIMTNNEKFHKFLTDGMQPLNILKMATQKVTDKGY